MNVDEWRMRFTKNVSIDQKMDLAILEGERLKKKIEDEINLTEMLILKMESQNFDISMHKKKKLAIELIERTFNSNRRSFKNRSRYIRLSQTKM